MSNVTRFTYSGKFLTFNGSRLGKPLYTLSDGLVAEWLFNGNADDTSGNNNHGIVDSGVTLDVDRHLNPNSCYNFTEGGNNSDTNGSIEIPSNTDYIFGTGDFCISIWANRDSINTTWGSMIEMYRYTNGVLVRYSQSTLQIYVSGDNYFINNVAIYNEWVHHIVQRKNGIVYVYINNELIGSSIMNKAITQGTYSRIGDSTHVSYQDFYGRLDDIRIYNRSLSEQEITQLYNE